MDDVDEEVDKAVEEANVSADSSGALDKVMVGLQQKFGGMRKFVMKQMDIELYGRNMIRAMEYSQWAKKTCISIDEGKTPKEHFLVAYKVAGRGIKLLDELTVAYPKAVSAALPMKQKIVAQCKQIQEAMKEEGINYG